MRLLILGLGLVFAVGSCSERPMPVEPAGKVSGGGLFDLFKTGGSAIVGVDSTASVSPADSTDAEVTDTTEAAPSDTTDFAEVLSDTTMAAAEGGDTTAALTAADARAELARRGIPYTDEAFRATAWDGDLEVVKLFVQAGMSVDAKGRNSGWTVLHLAAMKGHLEVVRYLVGQGADVVARDNNGDTARYFAAVEGHTDVASYLASLYVELEARTPEEARAKLDSLGIPYTARQALFLLRRGWVIWRMCGCSWSRACRLRSLTEQAGRPFILRQRMVG